MRLFGYHIRLAALGLARAPAVSAIMLVALALGNSIVTLSVVTHVRFHAYEVHLSPTLHQVEVLRPRDPTSLFVDGAASHPYLAPVAIQTRTQQSLAEMRTLARSQVPARRSSGIRAEVVVRGPSGPAAVRMARFTEAAFFPMFERPFAVGAPWPEATDAGASADATPVVLGHATGRALFPRGDALGQTVIVEGRPHRVVGVLASYQPLNAPWQLLMTGGREDALFLPLGDFDRLSAWPAEPLMRTAPAGTGRAPLLASDARFVISWVDLPTPEAVAAYRRDLDALLGPDRYVLRSLAEWHVAFPMPSSQSGFFSFLAIVVLVGGVFTLARFSLTKGLTLGAELGVYRALGAPRGALFARTWTEAMMIAVPAALLGPLAVMPTIWLFNRCVRVVDMPVEVGALSVVFSVLVPLVACALGALYPAWRLSRTRPTVYLGMG